MKEWQVSLGKGMFKYRSFMPLPLIFILFLVFRPGRMGPPWDCLISLFGLLISLVGQAIRVHSVGFSNRGASGRENFFKAEKLNTTGLYSLVRNPLYWGNVIIFLGLLLAFANPWAAALMLAFLLLEYHFIIRAEEDYLGRIHGDAFNAYCGQVRRIWPGFHGYKLPPGPFDLQRVILKENDSLFNIIICFLIIISYKELAFTGKWNHRFLIIVAALITCALYLGVKIFKKRIRKNAPL